MGKYISKFDIGDTVYRVYADKYDGLIIKAFFIEGISIDKDKNITYYIDDLNRNYYGEFSEENLIGDIETLRNFLDAFTNDPVGFDCD